INGPAELCQGTTNTYLASSSIAEPGYTWFLTNNTAQATLIGATDSASVQVASGTNGTFDLYCIVTDGEVFESCTTNIVVPAFITSSLLSDQTVCSNALAV